MQADGMDKRSRVTYIVELIEHVTEQLSGEERVSAYAVEADTILQVAHDWLDGKEDISRAILSARNFNGREYMAEKERWRADWSYYLGASQLACALDDEKILPNRLAYAALHCRDILYIVQNGVTASERSAMGEGIWQYEHLEELISAHLTAPSGDRLRPSLLAE